MADLRQRLQEALGDAYRLERELGGGGMSRLFLAEESSLHRKVVVKILPPEFASEVSAARFRQEVELAANLQHPNILPVLAAGTRDDLLYYIIPYVPGESLRHRLTRDGMLPVADAVEILREMADALAHAHAEGIIHRDIKPENVLLEGSHAVLTDFGIARALAESRSGERLTDTGLAVGTPGYMAPEQAAGERHIDARADVYALAVVGYEMLTGKPPFEGPTAQAVLAAHLTTTPKRLTAVRPDVPMAVSEVIARALAKNPAERLRTAAEFRAALRAAVVPEKPGRRPWLWVAAGAILLLLVAGGIALLRRSAGQTALDPDVIAVAPFDVLAPNIELWREGLVDVLSRNLDGAGPLRTVPASVVIKRWSGRADAPSATALGRATGARLAVFGQVVATRGDSVRLTATLFDVAAGHSIGEVEFRDLATSMDRLVDSVTVGLLRELGRSRPIGAVRATALRSTTLPALKAFLQGEQFFRRTAWDSALAAYQHAVALDSGLAVAWRRMASVIGWRVIGGDSLSEAYALRAAALNRGLAPRDSMLITAESLTAALFSASEDTAWRAHQRRLFATLEQATRLYPEDPEAWYELGDARLHFRQVGRTSVAQVLEPFDRAIALDSAFGESYLHPVGLAINLGRPELAREYIAGYLAHAPEADDRHAGGFRLIDQLLAHRGARPPELERLIDSASADELFDVWLVVSYWPDSGEAGVRIARALKASRRSDVPLFSNPRFRTAILSSALAGRGHLREAYAEGGDSLGPAGGMAVLGGVPEERAAALFRRWLADPPIHERPNAVPFGFNVRLFEALPWWSARRDTASLAAFAAKMRSLMPGAPMDVRPWLSYGAASAEAYASLAKADTARALDRFVNLPDTVCPCVFDQIITAQLLSARGKYGQAAAVFEGQYPPYWSAGTGLWRLERGRAFEREGQRVQAVEDYQYVVGAWRHGDPELQPYVAEAKAALVRLTGENK